MSSDAREERILSLVQRLEACLNEDPEEGHISADELLLEFIDDERVTKAFDMIKKWYA